MPTISTAARSASADAVVDLIDAGSGAGTLKFYTASKPAGPDTAVSGQTLCATLTFSDPAFGAASSGTATADTITAGTDIGTGTVTWARAADSDGNGVIDFTVGTSGADINLNSVTFTTSGAAVSVTSLTWTQPA